jgi:carbon starvation protein
MFVVFAVLFYSIKAIRRARSVGDRTDRETAYVALQPHEVNV